MSSLSSDALPAVRLSDVAQGFEQTARLERLVYESPSSGQQITLNASGTLSISGDSARRGGRIGPPASLTVRVDGRPPLTVHDWVRDSPLQTAQALIAKLPFGFSAEFTHKLPNPYSYAGPVELRIKYDAPSRLEIDLELRIATNELNAACARRNMDEQEIWRARATLDAAVKRGGWQTDFPGTWGAQERLRGIQGAIDLDESAVRHAEHRLARVQAALTFSP
jgi:hypothetical protein